MGQLGVNGASDLKERLEIYESRQAPAATGRRVVFSVHVSADSLGGIWQGLAIGGSFPTPCSATERPPEAVWECLGGIETDTQ